MIKGNIELVLAVENDGYVSFSRFGCDFSGSVFGVELFAFHRQELLSSFEGDVYVLGYFSDDKFYDQPFYIGKGKKRV